MKPPLKLIGCALFYFMATSHSNAHSWEVVSLYALVASPDKFQGKRVIVSGVFSTDGVLGRCELYVDEGSFKHRISANSILLPGDSVLAEFIQHGDLKQLHGKYVRVEGDFLPLSGLRSVARWQIDNVEGVIQIAARE